MRMPKNAYAFAVIEVSGVRTAKRPRVEESTIGGCQVIELRLYYSDMQSKLIRLETSKNHLWTSRSP